MKTVLFDVDNVVIDFAGAYLRIVNQTLGRFKKTPAELKDITQWDVGNALNLDKDERDRVHAKLYAHGFGFFGLDACEGAIAAIEKINKTSKLLFVTQPLVENPTWEHDRRMWFQHNLDQRFWPIGRSFVSRIINLNSEYKELIFGDVFVDDKPENVLSWARCHPNGYGFIWDYPGFACVEAKKKATEGRLPCASGGDYHLPRIASNVYITNDWDVVTDTATTW